MELLLIWIVVDYALGFSAPYVTRAYTFDQFISVIPPAVITGQLTVCAMWLVMGTRHWLSRLVIPCGLYAALHLFYDLRPRVPPPDWLGQGEGLLNWMALTYFAAQCLILLVARRFGIAFRTTVGDAAERRVTLQTLFSVTTAAALALFAARRFETWNIAREVLGTLGGQIYFTPTLLLTLAAVRSKSPAAGYLSTYGMAWFAMLPVFGGLAMGARHSEAWLQWRDFLFGMGGILIQPLTMALSLEYLAWRGLTLRPLSQKPLLANDSSADCPISTP